MATAGARGGPAGADEPAAHRDDRASRGSSRNGGSRPSSGSSRPARPRASSCSRRSATSRRRATTSSGPSSTTAARSWTSKPSRRRRSGKASHAAQEDPLRAESVGHHHHAERGRAHRRRDRQRGLGRRNRGRRFRQHRRHGRHRARQGRNRALPGVVRIRRSEELTPPERASHDWIFSLDADERIPPALAAEIRDAGLRANRPCAATASPASPFTWDAGSARPTSIPIFRRGCTTGAPPAGAGSTCTNRWPSTVPSAGFATTWSTTPSATSATSSTAINHYTTLAARQMHEAGPPASRVDLIVHPPAAFLRNYVLRRGILDGTAGLTISASTRIRCS